MKHPRSGQRNGYHNRSSLVGYFERFAPGKSIVGNQFPDNSSETNGLLLGIFDRHAFSSDVIEIEASFRADMKIVSLHDRRTDGGVQRSGWRVPIQITRSREPEAVYSVRSPSRNR